MNRSKRLGLLFAALLVLPVGISYADHHEGPPGEEGPPSPEQIRAMDEGIRQRIGALPEHLRGQADDVQDAHMQFVHSMGVGDDLHIDGPRFFDSSIGFLEKLKADPAAAGDPAVRKLILFIASDFGEGEIPPPEVPTLELIKGEIEHLKADRKRFKAGHGNVTGSGMGHDPNMPPGTMPPGGMGHDPNMPPGHDPNMPPGTMPPGGMGHDPNMPQDGPAPMSPDGALLIGPGMFPNVPPACSNELRDSELQPQGTVEHNGQQGNLIFRTVCNMPGWENNAITLPAGRNASAFDVEAATMGKIFFGVSVEGGAPVWTTADGKDAFHALHLTSAAPSANGKYTIFIDPAKSDAGVSVTVRFIDHQ